MRETFFVFLVIPVRPCLRAALVRAALNRHAVGSERDLDVAPHPLEHRHPSPQQLTHDHLRSVRSQSGGRATSGRGALERGTKTKISTANRERIKEEKNCIPTQRCVKPNHAWPRMRAFSLHARIVGLPKSAQNRDGGRSVRQFLFNRLHAFVGETTFLQEKTFVDLLPIECIRPHCPCPSCY